MMPASVYTRAAPAPSFHESGPHNGPAFLSPIATPCPSSPWQFVQCSMKSASPFRASSFSIGIKFDDSMTFWPRHGGFFPTSDPRASHVRYADRARTSGEVVDGNSSSTPPVAFSLRRKQSTIRSLRLYKRADRRLYSGNIPATPTRGSDRSRCPAFRWQLLHDILLGANCGASCGVLVKSRNPHLISWESLELSKDLSVSGFFGKYQAVTIFVAEETNGPLSL